MWRMSALPGLDSECCCLSVSTAQEPYPPGSRVVAVAHQEAGQLGGIRAITPYWETAARRALVDGLVAMHQQVAWPEPEPSGSQSPTLLSMSPRFAKYDLPSLCRYAEDARLETPKYPTQTWMEVAADSSYCEYLK